MSDAPPSNAAPTQAPTNSAPTQAASSPPEGTNAPPAATPPAQGKQPDAAGKAADATPTGKEAEAAQLLFDGDKPKEGEADATKDGEGKQDEAGEVSVKLEDLKLPEEIQIPEEMKGPLTDYIKEHKLDKDGAQKLTDLGVKMQQHNLKVWTDTKAAWRKEVETDPVLGGQNLKATVTKANEVIRKFAGTEEHLNELKQDLVLLGLGNKRSFVRFLSNIAAATGNDSANAAAGAAKDNSPDARAKRMYPNMA